jgi:hypothetical protein
MSQRGTARVATANRAQISFAKVDLDAALPAGHLARMVVAFVDRMDLRPFYIKIVPPAPITAGAKTATGAARTGHPSQPIKMSPMARKAKQWRRIRDPQARVMRCAHRARAPG